MKCEICNVVIDDDGYTAYCYDEEAHGGYACEECCDDAQIPPEPCITCGLDYCKCDMMYDDYRDSLLERD